jgi:hypothetical protein
VAKDSEFGPRLYRIAGFGYNLPEAQMLTRIAALSFGIAISSAVPAFAGGDDYDPGEDAQLAGPAYIGFVRDARGVPLSEVQVVLRPKEGAPVTLRTNSVGYYRSHISKDISPADVEVICSKDGYDQANGVRRAHPSNAPFVETNCTLRRL